ncbi:hypothetical protein [Cytobacillus pseudoceanisediminis]|uniref:hypothetical protein n=1 Tax=Cytobacillus pseudoceanisediminis TaxID=3051614 RepID=UPI003C2B6314
MMMSRKRCRLDEQQTYIQERMVEDDRRLMKLIRESQEIKQQLLQRAVANEE